MNFIKASLFDLILSRSHTVQLMKKEIYPDLDLDVLLEIKPDTVHYVDFLLKGVKTPKCSWFDDDIFYIENDLLPLQDLENYEICDIRKLVKNKYISIKDYDIISLAENQRFHILKALLPFFEDIDKKDSCRKTALHHACEHNKKDLVKMLIKAGCNLEKT